MLFLAPIAIDPSRRMFFTRSKMDVRAEKNDVRNNKMPKHSPETPVTTDVRALTVASIHATPTSKTRSIWLGIGQRLLLDCDTEQQLPSHRHRDTSGESRHAFLKLKPRRVLGRRKDTVPILCVIFYNRYTTCLKTRMVSRRADKQGSKAL